MEQARLLLTALWEPFSFFNLFFTIFFFTKST